MREPTPYFKKSHRCWYVNIQGKPVRLDKDKDKAQLAFHAIMAGTREITSKTPVVELCSEFLVDCHRQNEQSTYNWYRDHLESFCNFIGKLQVSQLKPYHVERWIAKRYPTTTNPNTIHGAMRPICRVMNWATKSGRIAANPIQNLVKPAPTNRDVYLTPEQFDVVIKTVRHETMRELMTLLRETGCRPMEARMMEARHFNRTERTITFPKAEAKGKKEARVILLNDRAFEIICRRVLKYPAGRLFLNRLGNKYTRGALNSFCARLTIKLGFHVCPYAVRHTFATDAIVRGVDLLTIAHLMGHKDLKMLQRFYSHINKRADYLREGLKRATG